MLGPWLTLAHGIWFEPGDILLLAERGVGVAHNPSSNLRLRSGIAPLADLLAAGVTLGIGLDGQTLDDDQDHLREMRLAWTLANRPGASSPTVNAAQVLHMGTERGAAITVGPGARLGRLAPGYIADLVLIESGDGLDDWSIGLAGAVDAAAVLPQLLLLRGASRRHVRDVMVNGTWVVRQGRSARLDEHAIIVQLRENLAASRAQSSSAAERLKLQQVQSFTRAFYMQWGGPRAHAEASGGWHSSPA
jgi:cytosine/adenosine deaminase-related metal-dependent hydrolase